MLVSLLDNDLYKFSMQQAALQLYPSSSVVYKFKNRKPLVFKFSKEAITLLQSKINALENLILSENELIYLNSLPYFSQTYLNFLKSFTFKPKEHVSLVFNESENYLEISISGRWIEVILYEVPILSLISESYFQIMDTDWSMDGQFDQAYAKGLRLINGGCSFSEFGTRRRRSFEVQKLILEGLIKAEKELAPTIDLPLKHNFAGTSNVYFAMLFGLTPVGTVAHEWTMAMSALEKDLLHANKNAITKWLEVYPSPMPGFFSTALCDTYGTPAFLKDFSKDLALTYAGVRQDSGDPKIFVDRVVSHYLKIGVDPSTKFIVFSDSLNVEKCLDLELYCKNNGKGIGAKYGIGTHFTNDFVKQSDKTLPSKAMDIVIKLAVVDGIQVVKLSDDAGKNQGDNEAVGKALEIFGFQS